jgi:hypothetical protein
VLKAVRDIHQVHIIALHQAAGPLHLIAADLQVLNQGVPILQGHRQDHLQVVADLRHAGDSNDIGFYNNSPFFLRSVAGIVVQIKKYYEKENYNYINCFFNVQRGFCPKC